MVFQNVSLVCEVNLLSIKSLQVRRQVQITQKAPLLTIKLMFLGLLALHRRAAGCARWQTWRCLCSAAGGLAEQGFM